MNNVLFFIFTSVTIILSTGLNIKTSSRSALSMNFLGDLFKKSPQSTSMSNSKLIFTDSAPSWEELDQYIRRMEPATERSAFDSIQTGRGVTNHKANIRLFDAPDGYKPEITLYRDTAGWCPYCQKVWLQLEEKRLPYQVIKVPMRCYGDKPESFYKLNPSGGIPVATIKGKTLAESNDIMNEIEREFPSYKPLYPASGSPHAARVPGLLKLERRVFSVWFNWLTTNADAPAEKEMDSLLRQVDDELRSTQSGGPYFLGADVSIVDVMFAPFLERMAASLPYYKGFESRTSKYPNLLRWYESMDTRESFRGIKSDYYTHCRDLPPQIGRCYFRLPLAERFRDEIDGGAWRVDKSVSELVEPMLPADPVVAASDAARNVISNHANLVRFCLRAVGERGSQRVSAPLSDPSAVPNEAYFPYVDSAMRHVTGSLLSMYPLTERVSSTAYVGSVDEVTQCLEYVRERVSVPRDMTVHGARLFRAHINNYIDSVKIM